MTISDIIQRKITELIEIAITGEAVEIGRSACNLLKKCLPEIKNDLKLDFDSFVVNPSTHPRDSADIMLYKNNKLIRKISVKTAVSANIRATIDRLKKEKHYDEDAIIIFGLFAKKNKASKKVFALILIPKEILFEFSKDRLYNAILTRIDEKKQKEKYDDLFIMAINESVILETATSALQASKLAEQNRKAIEENRKAIEENRKAIEKTRTILEKKIDTLQKTQNEILTKIDNLASLLKHLKKD